MGWSYDELRAAPAALIPVIVQAMRREAVAAGAAPPKETDPGDE